MRFIPEIFQKVANAQTDGFIGDNKPAGRVTVEPLWQLQETGAVYGNSVRGPYRYFQDVNDVGVQWEVPNIKDISWDRSEGQDIATCTITLYNMWHEGNLEAPELSGQLGKPGYFWPKRGGEFNRWSQEEAKGAFRSDGFWDPNFSWINVLERYAKIRTFEGYGGHPTAENFTSVQDNIDNGNLVITGTWLIDNITAGSNGEMVLSCKDMGKILLEELCFAPVVPDGLYPLEYYPAGKSAFDSVFGPRPKAGVSPGSQGEVRSDYFYSSLDRANADSPDFEVDGHKGSHSNDGNWQTYSLSEAYALPDDGTVFWDFDIFQPVTKVSLKAWAGGYDCYVSVMKDDDWLGTEVIPGIPGGVDTYVTKIKIPFAIPDNQEPVVNIELPSEIFDTATTVNTHKIRISFTHLYYSGIPDGDDNMYRGGIRDFIVYREGAKVDPYSPDFATIPWTFSMTQHPTRGYWVIDDAGNVYGFGDAADYDSTAFGQVPLTASGHSDNQSIAMCAHPDGKGYWVVDLMGEVYAYGSATHYGDYQVAWPGTDVWGEDGLAAWDITATHTGNGYWVCYGDGTIKGFGDATPNDETLPWSDVAIFMNTFVNPRYLYQRQATGITSHPHKMGFWVTTGSGEVYAFGECVQYGQLQDRVYNPGMADSFHLAKTEFTKSIESTVSGNGYWIAFGSGHIAAFGDAIGQGPTYIYPNPNLDIVIDETNIQDWSFFRAIVWDMCRDPDGTGFWVLVADGNVGGYSAEFWGSPSYTGLSGFRWHEGNFDGDWSSIMKELLMWSGFTFYDPDATEDDTPAIFGSIESTGIKTDSIVSADKFDKRPILDIIKELCEVVAYRFSIQEDGGVKITSPNFWRSGNFDIDGVRIYVDGDSYDRVASDAVGAVEFIPVIDEEVDMFDYNTTLSSDSMRSEIIIGTDQPDPKNPLATGFVRHTPRFANEEVAPGVPMLRGIPRVGMWISQLFTNPEEAELMAELISLTAWFSERSSTTNCVANPCLSLGDQVKFMERNTSEYYIHYVSGINSHNDLDSGEWTYTLTSHWLGDKDNWVITADSVDAPVSGEHYIEISERVDRWQLERGRGLQKGGYGRGTLVSTLTGEFDKTSTSIADGMWIYDGTLVLNKRLPNVPITVRNLNPPLGTQVFCEVYSGSDLIINQELNTVNVTSYLPALGNDGELTTYSIKLKGYPASTGNGILGFSIAVGTTELISSDTLLVTK